MKFVKVGKANSEEEYDLALKQMSKTIGSLKALQQYGFFLQLLEAGNWDKARPQSAWAEPVGEDGTEGLLVVYTGRVDEPTGKGRPKLFVALHLSKTGRLLALLKIEKYDGEKTSWRNNLAEARERLHRGEFFDAK